MVYIALLGLAFDDVRNENGEMEVLYFKGLAVKAGCGTNAVLAAIHTLERFGLFEESRHGKREHLHDQASLTQNAGSALGPVGTDRANHPVAQPISAPQDWARWCTPPPAACRSQQLDHPR